MRLTPRERDAEVAKAAKDLLEHPYELPALKPGDIVLIIGEPGMEKTATGRGLFQGTRDWRSKGYSVYAMNRGEGLAEKLEATKKLALSRNRRSRNQDAAVMIDGFPAVDEQELEVLSNLIREMANEGTAVVVTLRPEAEQLQDALPEAMVVKPGDLLWRRGRELSEASERAWELTGGIPLLVDALVLAGDPMGSRFTDALGSLAEATVRDGVTEDERNVRLAMIMLGRGSFDELASVTGAVDDETMTWLSKEVPILGIDLLGRSFKCAGLFDDAAFRTCFSTLRRGVAPSARVGLSAVDRLAERGDFVRAGTCLALCEPDERQCKLGLRWGLELTATGCTPVMRDCVARARKLFMTEEDGFALSVAAHLQLEGRVSSAMRSHEEAHATELAGRRRTHLSLLNALRRLDAGLKADEVMLVDEDGLATQLQMLVDTQRRLLAGRFAEAAALAPAGPLALRPTSLPEAALACELYLAMAFAGDKPTRTMTELYEMGQTSLEHFHLRRLAAYARAIPDLVEVGRGGCSAERLEQAVAKAQTEGDVALETAFLVAATVSDLRQGSVAAAHVRATRAERVSRGIVNEDLRDTAVLVDAAVMAELGDTDPLEGLAYSQRRTPAADLARMLLSAIGGLRRGEELPRMQVLRSSLLPRDARWLCGVLARDCGTVSSFFYGRIPEGWRKVLSSGEKPRASVGGGEKHKETEEPPAPKAVVALHEVRIGLFGGFSVTVDGRPIPPEHFKRRNSGLLLALLCVRKGHVMRRTELVEMMWPDAEYSTGFQRLYEAESGARNAMGSIKQDFDPFVLGRTNGTVALNGACVTCDLDLFDRAVRGIEASEGDDDEVVRRACEARDIYAGELDVGAAGDTAESLALADELRGSFADAMVAGSAAALRLNRPLLAVQLAKEARGADDLREDGAEALLRALCLAGRKQEAQDEYVRYCGHVVSVTGLPPSRRLRQLAQELLPGGAGGEGTITQTDVDY